MLAAVALFGGCAQSAPEVELGSGAERFEPIVDGQDLPIVEGAQGGHHLWIALRARGLDVRTTEVLLQLEPRATGRPVQSSVRSLDPEAQDGWHHHLGVPTVFSSPECFRDREVLLRVQLTDSAARSARDERVVVPRWPTPLGECGLN